ncbi:hypothetical protein CDAR_584551 [Caerostris darwini]|uniref:Uncharacterized protein n=1 Tax=Caerostris darwini TaxID=1538125 RepID=A0AAV4WIC9_9ARAC|nr:hypothetical protein CDAR_584551 [Caerostris darwini]
MLFGSSTNVTTLSGRMHYMVHQAICLRRKSVNCVCAHCFRLSSGPSPSIQRTGASSISVSSLSEISPSKSPPTLSTVTLLPAIYFAPR